MNSPVDGLSIKQTGRLMDEQTDGQIDGYMEEWLGRKVVDKRQMDRRHTDKRQID
jgi:hypothetical protein